MVWLSERWRLWDQFAVRGAGFPADGVLRLAPDGLAAAADELGPVLSGPTWELFEERFAESAVETAVELQAVAALPAFRAAVQWQNPAALRTGVDPFTAWRPSAAGRTSKPRQREELVAHYWQRFCVKNDTIGFFGPVGWGRWDGTIPGLEVDAGRGLVARSTVYFSSWSVDALAGVLSADPAARRWIAPRRVPFVRVDEDVDGGAVVLPGLPPTTIPAELRGVLDLCDGVRTEQAIQRELGDGVDVAAALAELCRRRWVVQRLDLPAGARPERHLRAWLTGVGDADLRHRGLAVLDGLERARDQVRTAAHADLPAALDALACEFTAVTGAATTRTKGAGTAPGRGLVYADCVRAGSTRVGAGVLTALAPLDLLLTAASWLTARLADAVLDGVRRVHADLAAAGSVDLAAFWFACMPVLHGTAAAEAESLRRALSTRWARVLDIAPGARRVRVRGTDIADRVREAFGEPGARWGAARYASPDVFVVAADDEHLRRGDVDLVLGELHVAANTLGASLFVNQHPAPGELVAETTTDFPGPRLLPVLPKEHRSRLSTRIHYSLARPEDYRVALVDNTADLRRDRAVLSADARVRERGGDLVAVLPDGAEFPVLDVFGHVLTTLAMDLFQVLPADADHTPRVAVDRLVVARESWSVDVGALTFAEQKSEARRFVLARAWARSLGLPRFAFAVLPGEPRPFYVDFDAPVYVNVLAKAVRRLARRAPAGRVVVTEMLPTPEQAWLVDDAGARYTSELRFVAVDRPDR
ncbi:lantibiotic dehydratase [Saccharothrix sp. Mg75]|uniref:lantibiotic dehydratase n=1 Tax=Saccharothrix sp. Mg75 TaxID=3445357 RepID=UPI003EE82EAC